jgi:hypothetical protein
MPLRRLRTHVDAGCPWQNQPTNELQKKKTKKKTQFIKRFTDLHVLREHKALGLSRECGWDWGVGCMEGVWIGSGSAVLLLRAYQIKRLCVGS